MHLASISGGTDIIGCFVGGNPAGPVGAVRSRRAASAWPSRSSTRTGRPCAARKASWCAPRRSRRCRWGSGTIRTARKYHAAYFERYPGVWHHGDYVELTAHGGVVIYGRSDAVLNPGGVRIGTAEIYRQVEQIPEVLESLVDRPATGTTMSGSSSSCGCRTR